MSDQSHDYSFYFHEMMVHPVLFTHRAPVKVAMIGESRGILDEVLKHDNIESISCINNIGHNLQNPRVKHITLDAPQWLPNSYDIIIHAKSVSVQQFSHYAKALTDNGIFIQPCPVSVFEYEKILTICNGMNAAGFAEWQLLNFSQPGHEDDLQTLIMATKNPTFKRIRERDIYNRNFKTKYYNYDIHRAALALPEYIRDALGMNEDQA